MEEAPDQEFLDYVALIDALKTKGIEDPGTKQLLTSWTEKQEKKVEEERIMETYVELENSRGTLYLEAGLLEEAKAAFEAALVIAKQEGFEGALTWDIEEKLDSL